MSSRVRAHLRGNVVGYVALFFALTGVAWAAHKAPKNSVVTKSIKNGAVTNSKVASNSLTGAKIQAGTLGQVPSATDSERLGGSGASAFLASSRVQQVSYDATVDAFGGGNNFAPILSAAGLLLQARCPTTPPFRLVIQATSSGGGTIEIGGVEDETGTLSGTDPKAAHFNLAASSATEILSVGDPPAAPDGSRIADDVTLTYFGDHTVTLPLTARIATLSAGTDLYRCDVHGIAVTAP